jgi:hypothetical protein
LLRRFAPRNDGVKAMCAANRPDGQITEKLSSPSRKNIPLNLSGKSVI